MADEDGSTTGTCSTTDADQAPDAQSKIADVSGHKAKSFTPEILQAASKFRQSLVISKSMKQIEPTLFDEYVMFYKEYAKEIDPTICNKVLMLYIEVQY